MFKFDVEIGSDIEFDLPTEPTSIFCSVNCHLNKKRK